MNFQHQNLNLVQQQEPARNPRKRKASPVDAAQSGPPPPQQQQQPSQPQPPPQQQQLQHVLPPPHAMMHPMQPGPMPGYQYDYSPGGMPPPPPNTQQDPNGQQQNASSSRPLSNSKRAEQNRKAQRAFRERRDQHVKALESRSQLLDAALQSADEANRRWEECRALVDQLRVENTALRAALAQAQGQQQVQVLSTGVLMQAEEHKKENDSQEDQKE